MTNLFPQQSTPQPEGSLERLGVQVETEIDPNVLTTGGAKAIRFRGSKPSGYSFQEVDDFVNNIVVPSIDWYSQTLYQRDKVVHTLGRALDQAETDIKNLKSQLQFVSYNSQIKEGIDLNKDDKEVAGLMQRLTEAEAELKQLKENPTAAAQQTGGDSENLERIAELETYIDAVSKQYQTLVDQYETDTAALQGQIDALTQAGQALTPETGSNAPEGAPDADSEALKGRITELEEYINTIRTQYEELVTAYTELTENPATPESSSQTITEEQYNQLETENQALRNRVTELEEQLTAGTPEPEEEQPEEPKRLPLPSEEQASVNATQYENLPPGIKPEDL